MHIFPSLIERFMAFPKQHRAQQKQDMKFVNTLVKRKREVNLKHLEMRETERPNWGSEEECLGKQGSGRSGFLSKGGGGL
jgi:hypothetical protein